MQSRLCGMLPAIPDWSKRDPQHLSTVCGSVRCPSQMMVPVVGRDVLELDTGFYQPNLSVRPALEALLTQAAGRQDAGARQARVLAAALMACAETGYAHLTVADIARRAKVSTATIYADYKDRDALLVAAIELVLGIVAQDVIELPDTPDPVQQVELLLIAHGAVYRDPFMIWILRMHVTLASSGYGHLHQIGRQVFEGIDRFWAGFLGSLVAAGHLRAIPVERVVPLILGPIERCTVLARLSCGPQGAAGPSLEAVARHAARTLFAVCGSERIQARLGTVGEALPHALLAVVPNSAQAGTADPTTALQQRLTGALAHLPDTQSLEDRRRRILLAAAVECQARGYSAASMVEAAGRARASTATLYKLFADKADLFTSAVEQEGQPETTIPTACDQLPDQLYALASQRSDPQTAWVHALIMASEIADTPRITALGRARWIQLEQQLAGWLPAASDDQELAVNFLLGGIERTGVLGLILFGNAAVDPAQLRWLSDAAAALWQAASAPSEASKLDKAS